MALDLSALSAPAAPAAGVVVDDGAPREAPRIALVDIDEDPEQPRREFAEDAMQGLQESIARSGVKTPVSVRPNPDQPGRWILNYGARRFRASKALGLPDIPAFVDNAHDDYDQVVENIQRSDLRPMELALFIKRKLAEGVKKGVIAKKLGKDAAVITWHAALIDAPACIEDLYSTGRCTTAQYLYDLVKLHSAYPEQVEAWCESAEEVTRRTITELSDELKGKKAGLAGAAGDAEGGHGKGKDPTAGQGVGKGEGSATTGSGAGADGEGGRGTRGKEGKGGTEEGGDGGDAAGSSEDRSSVTVQRIPAHNPDLEKDPDDAPESDKLKKPLMLVEYEGRPAMVVFRMPSAAGLLRIRYEDGGGDDEVDAGRVKINCLMRESA